MKNKIKLLLIFSFLLIILSELLISNNPMSSYSLSIYSQVNTFALLILMFTLISGISISVWDLYSENPYSWKYGLIIVIFVNTIIILLPSSLGYKFNTSLDMFDHMGYAVTIINTGHIYFNHDIYPVIHILYSNISLLTGQSINKITNYLGISYYALFILSTYILSNYLLKKKAAILATICSTVPFFYFYYSVFPLGYAFITFILVFFLYFKYKEKKSVQFGILILIFMFYMTFIHPLGAIFLSLALISIEISNYFIQHQQLKKIFPVPPKKKKFTVSLSFILIALIVLNLWLWNNFKYWSAFVEGIQNIFTFDLSTTPLTQRAAEGFSTLHLSLIDIASLFIRTYGAILLFGILSIYTIFIIFRNQKLIKNYSNRMIYFLSLIFLLFCVLAINDIIQPLTFLSSGRLIILPTMLLPIFTGLALIIITDYKFNVIKNKKLLATIPIFIITIASIIGVFALFPSPMIYKINPAITTANFDGMEWIVNNGNPQIQSIVLPPLDNLYRYVNINGFNNQSTLYQYQILGYKFPDHFNYTNSSNFGSNFNSTIYMITSEKSTVNVYIEIFPTVNRFTISDFNKLKNDNTVQKIYENGEIQNWIVN